MRQDTCFPHARSQPLPHEPHDTPIVDPSAEDLPQLGPGDAIAVSTHICIHDPADALRHAPLPPFVPCVMRAATPPEAVRAVVEVSFVERFPPPRHRSLANRVLE